MGFDNFIDIVFVDELIPDGLGIDHHGRPFEAASQAASFVDSYHARLVELEFGNACFRVIEDLARAERTAAGITIVPLVATDKNVALKEAHDVS